MLVESSLDSLEKEQKSACTEFANRNNYQIVKTYVDEAKSGTSDKRTSFQEMLTDARSLEKPFDYILVYNYERFSRSRQDQINYKNELRFLDIFSATIRAFLLKCKFLEDKASLFLFLIVLQSIIFD